MRAPKVKLAWVGLAVLVAVCAVLAWRRWREYQRRRRELFWPALIGIGLTGFGVGAKVTGLDKVIQDKLKLDEKLGGKKPGGDPASTAAPAFTPTYAGRVWDGVDWSCPDNTIETDNTDNAKACISSTHHNPVWKPVAGTWGWNCPAGSVPTDDPTWEKKCEMGWTQRVQNSSAWACPGGTTDTGNTWDKNPGRDGAKQCKRSKAYTQRVSVDNKWVCPEGTKDTGRTWGQPGEWNQCKWTGP